MSETDVQQYKPAKTTIQQIEYLKNNKRVTFNEIGEDEASELLLRYNYINSLALISIDLQRLMITEKL